MDDESLGSDADREILEAMHASAPGRLSKDFQDSLWKDIASELHRTPAAPDKSKISKHTWRRLGAIAAGIVLVAPLAVVLIARHTDGTDQISSSPNSSLVPTDDSAATSPTSSSAAPAETSESTTADTSDPGTSSTAAPAETTTAPLTTAGTTASTTPSTFASLPDATDGSVDGPRPAIPGSVIASARMSSATTGWVVTDAVLAHTEDAG
ncbi:MAG: hypothetical protein JWL72_2229, partial [Ilumatobacteraceae bacterium]|nr:hypothetical protein [Ilumatobacteraceae bacterium]